MSVALLLDALAWLLGAAAVAAAWLVFRTDSMVRAAYGLLASFPPPAGSCCCSSPSSSASC